MDIFEDLRKQMIEYQLEARGLKDQTVLNAIRAVPRESFYPLNWLNLPTEILLCQSPPARPYHSPISLL
jgi:protein-L-isoaspartate O-methyltransferase